MIIVKRLLVVLHVIVGVGGLAGGYNAIAHPMAPMGASVELLKNSPFTDFLIPGLILFSIIGVGNLISAVLFLKKLPYQGYISSVFSWALVIWIIVQCMMIQAVVFLHVLFFIIGKIFTKESSFPAIWLIGSLRKLPWVEDFNIFFPRGVNLLIMWYIFFIQTKGV